MYCFEATSFVYLLNFCRRHRKVQLIKTPVQETQEPAIELKDGAADAIDIDEGKELIAIDNSNETSADSGNLFQLEKTEHTFTIAPIDIEVQSAIQTTDNKVSVFITSPQKLDKIR